MAGDDQERPAHSGFDITVIQTDPLVIVAMRLNKRKILRCLKFNYKCLKRDMGG